MGSQTIPSRTNGQIIDEQWFNIFRQAFMQDQVARNSSGIATDQSGSLGTSSIRFLNSYLMNLLLMDGTKFIKQKAPAGLVADYTLTLPPGLPASGKTYTLQCTDAGIMTFAAITGDQMEAAVSLPIGALISGQNIAMSNIGERVAIIRGRCNGTASGSGTGFTWTSPSTGVYTVNFGGPFSDTPAVVACIDNTSVSDTLIVTIGATNSGTTTVVIVTPSGVRTSTPFYFIANGLRG